MKMSLLLAGVLAAVFTAGCSTVGSRIAKSRAEFSSWPLEVQQKIEQGQVDVGFTAEQVRVALGEPDRVFTRTTTDGTSEVWAYRDRGPKIGFGLGVGVGGFSGSRSVGGGVAVGTGTRDYYDEEKTRVVFTRGKVTAVETSERK